MNKDVFQIVRFGSDQEFLTALNRSNINALNEYSQNLLQEAIANDKSNIALELIKRGIDLNHQDSEGSTSLHFSVVHNNINILNEIIRNNGNVNLRDIHGNNPLWTAVFNAKGNYKMVNTLVKFGADIVTKNKHGKSPLDFAHQINDKLLCDILENSSI